MELTNLDKLAYVICPVCEQDYAGLKIESSREMQLSRISCTECGQFSLSAEECEEDLADSFFEIYEGPLNDECPVQYSES